MAPNQNDPPAPERAPGGGRGMKTKWRAKPMIGSSKWWCVRAGDDVVARYLDKPTALKIAAVNEMEAALENVHKWLMDVFTDKDLENDVYNESFRKAAKTTRAALSKARGEGHE